MYQKYFKLYSNRLFRKLCIIFPGLLINKNSESHSNRNALCWGSKGQEARPLMSIEPWSLLNSRGEVFLTVSSLLVTSIVLWLSTHHAVSDTTLTSAFLIYSSVFCKDTFVRLRAYLDCSGNCHSGIHNHSCKDLLFLDGINSGYTRRLTQTTHTHTHTSVHSMQVHENMQS